MSWAFYNSDGESLSGDGAWKFYSSAGEVIGGSGGGAECGECDLLTVGVDDPELVFINGHVIWT